jgi:hypothetical protein
VAHQLDVLAHIVPQSSCRTSPDSISMALFCDFENVALGVRDAKYDKFDIKLEKCCERLLLKGSIVVKKAYCDWERYKASRPRCTRPTSS